MSSELTLRYCNCPVTNRCDQRHRVRRAYLCGPAQVVAVKMHLKLGNVLEDIVKYFLELLADDKLAIDSRGKIE